jgi:shikimate O-hydroxycinnamoyltransferase
VKTIPLSPIDHIFTGAGSYPIEFVFAYSGELDFDALRASLEATLEHFGPLRSRLVRTSDASYGLAASDDGLVFDVTNLDEPLDLAINAYDFLSPVDTVEDEPLTRIRLTHTPVGSVLGVSISHAVVDGFSYFHFLSSWARAHNGKPFHPPSHERELLIPEASTDSPGLDPAAVLAGSGTFWADKRKTIDRSQLAWDTISFTREAMNELLRQGQKDVDVRLSHHDVITAHLWRTYLSEWTSSDDGEAYISCPVDFRRRMKPFPLTYFGCAVSLATDSIAYDELMTAPLGALALNVRSAIASIDPDYTIRALHTLERLRLQEGLSALEEVHVIHPRSGLLVTNLSRLPVNEIAFDAGPPTGFAILTPTERGAVVLPADDGVEIRVCLPVQDAAAATS